MCELAEHPLQVLGVEAAACLDFLGIRRTIGFDLLGAHHRPAGEQALDRVEPGAGDRELRHQRERDRVEAIEHRIVGEFGATPARSGGRRLIGVGAKRGRLIHVPSPYP